MKNKVNTFVIVLLLVIIILLAYIAFGGKKNEYQTNSYLPDVSLNNEFKNTENVNKVKNELKPESTNYQFLKDIVSEFPDSYISECKYNGQKLFHVSRDKVVNGSHLVGGASTIFSLDGKQIASCPVHPDAPKICNAEMSCVSVYGTKNGWEGIDVDIYNLK